jgi:hypothetical protein
MKQRLPKVQDTRPHRDAGHQTEIVKRLAASGVQESKTPASAGVIVLNGPSTQVKSFYAKAHSVQDTAVYNEYTAGQAVAQSDEPQNAKTPQIRPVCYTSTTVPEYNDRLARNAQLSLVQAQKNTYQRGWNVAACCTVCGKPPVFDGGCECRLTVAQQVGLPTSRSRPQVPS